MVVTVVVAVVPRVTKALYRFKETRTSMRETKAVEAKQQEETAHAVSARSIASVLRRDEAVRCRTYQYDGAILLGTVEQPEPHGGTKQLSGDGVTSRGRVRVEPIHGAVPAFRGTSHA